MVRSVADYDVVIVGGGVAGAGLLAAMGSQGSDARILLVEQTSKPGSINRGELLWPPQLEVLERWGVLPEIRRRGAVPMRGNELLDHHGTTFMRTDLSYFGTAFPGALALEHPQIEESFLSAGEWNPNVSVWTETRFEGLEEHDATGATVRLRRGERLESVRTKWLVGADGRASRVRQAVGIESAMRPYPYEFLVTRVPVQDRWRETAAQFLGPYGFLGLFVVNGPYSRLVLSMPSGTSSQFMELPEDLRNAEVARRAPLLAGVPVRWDQVHTYKLFEHHAPSYHRGRVVLVGDAAHTFTPMLGLGMNLAIEDADTLARLLSDGPLRERLDERILREQYERPRRTRNHRALKRSREQGEFQVKATPLQLAFFKAWCGFLNRCPVLQRASLRYLFG